MALKFYNMAVIARFVVVLASIISFSINVSAQSEEAAETVTSETPVIVLNEADHAEDLLLITDSSCTSPILQQTPSDTPLSTPEPKDAAVEASLLDRSEEGCQQTTGKIKAYFKVVAGVILVPYVFAWAGSLASMVVDSTLQHVAPSLTDELGHLPNAALMIAGSLATYHYVRAWLYPWLSAAGEAQRPLCVVKKPT